MIGAKAVDRAVERKEDAMDTIKILIKIKVRLLSVIMPPFLLEA